ncbi:MAG: hypothetical protein GEU88_19585 [Solirubrobacterales bacterium]|nr:hypothetical protein [Solirubrobacterales bacterium]
MIRVARERERRGQLPGRSDLDAIADRRETRHLDDAGCEKYVLVRQRSSWGLLDVWCTDEPGLRHDSQGDYRHGWGYGGHGPHDTALSLIIDAAELDPRAPAREPLTWPISDVVEILRRIAHDEEWALTRGDVIRACRGFDGRHWGPL